MLEPREAYFEARLLCFINKSIYDAHYVYLKLYDRVICAHLYKRVPCMHAYDGPTLQGFGEMS